MLGSSAAAMLTGVGGSGMGKMSREFFDLVRAIGETRSRQEEERLMACEVASLRVHFAELFSKNTTDVESRMKELAVRLLYCEMLGHDVSFAHVHAMKMAGQKSIWLKRIGYLVTNLCFRNSQEELLLLINTIQKDLASCDFLQVLAGLAGCSQIIHNESIPILLHSVLNLTGHVKAPVRRRALSVLLRFYTADPSILPQIKPVLLRSLHDRHLGVLTAVFNCLSKIHTVQMGAATATATTTTTTTTTAAGGGGGGGGGGGDSGHTVSAVTATTASGSGSGGSGLVRHWEGLIPILASLLREIVTGNLKQPEYDYQRVAAPFVQMKLISLLARLVGRSQQASQQVYETFRLAMSRCEFVSNVSHAVMHELAKAVGQIYPHPSLTRLAVHTVGRFLQSRNKNLMLVALAELAQLVAVEPAYIKPHQLIVVECLEDRDASLRSRALDLVCSTTSSANVVPVVARLIEAAQASQQDRPQIVRNAIRLIERHAPSHDWYLDSLTNLLALFSGLVPLATVKDVVQLLADGPSDDAEENERFRARALRNMMTLVRESADPETLVDLKPAALHLIFWVFAAYLRSLSHTADSWPPSPKRSAKTRDVRRNKNIRGDDFAEWESHIFALWCSQLDAKSTTPVATKSALLTNFLNYAAQFIHAMHTNKRLGSGGDGLSPTLSEGFEEEERVRADHIKLLLLNCLTVSSAHQVHGTLDSVFGSIRCGKSAAFNSKKNRHGVENGTNLTLEAQTQNFRSEIAAKAAEFLQCWDASGPDGLLEIYPPDGYSEDLSADVAALSASQLVRRLSLVNIPFVRSEISSEPNSVPHSFLPHSSFKRTSTRAQTSQSNDMPDDTLEDTVDDALDDDDSDTLEGGRTGSVQASAPASSSHALAQAKAQAQAQAQAQALALALSKKAAKAKTTLSYKPYPHATSAPSYTPAGSVVSSHDCASIDFSHGSHSPSLETVSSPTNLAFDFAAATVKQPKFKPKGKHDMNKIQLAVPRPGDGMKSDQFSRGEGKSGTRVSGTRASASGLATDLQHSLSHSQVRVRGSSGMAGQQPAVEGEEFNFDFSSQARKRSTAAAAASSQRQNEKAAARRKKVADSLFAGVKSEHS